ERLDAEAIACQKQPALPLVPERKREHPAQVFDGVRTELLVEMDDRFGVTRRTEHVSAAREPRPQLAVVVDLAVEHDPDGAVLVRHGLVSVLEIDDAQPPHAEGDAVAEMDAFVIRSTVRHRAAHGADLAVGHRTATRPEDSCNPAHEWILELLLAACYLLLATCCLLLAACCLRLATRDSRLATRDLLLATCYSGLAARGERPGAGS